MRTGVGAGRGAADDAPATHTRKLESEMSPEATRTGPDDPGSILVADDNEDCRIALRAILESLGYTVHEAVDGESAVAVARREIPDLILMDIMMPGVDGLEATRRIRSVANLEDTRIVAVSAMEGARQPSLAAGCDDCILKPIDLKGLDELVADWLSAG